VNKKGQKSSWEREQWIVSTGKGGKVSEGGKNRDKTIVKVKLRIQKRKKLQKNPPGTTTIKSSVCLVKVLELFLLYTFQVLPCNWEL
jgi:hypothetical protein